MKNPKPSRRVRDYRDALERTHGYPSQAALLLGVGPSAVTNMMTRHPELRNFSETLQKGRQAYLLDTAENALKKAVEKGASWAVRYVLDSLGAARGFDPRMKVDATLKSDGVVIVEVPPIEKDPEKWARLYGPK